MRRERSEIINRDEDDLVVNKMFLKVSRTNLLIFFNSLKRTTCVTKMQKKTYRSGQARGKHKEGRAEVVCYICKVQNIFDLLKEIALKPSHLPTVEVIDWLIKSEKK